jgi:vacuolar-type H+-ATPase subunit F/Vma7
MIVIGNRDFVTGMKICGVIESHVVNTAEEIAQVIPSIRPNQLILANAFVVALYPRLQSYPNLVTIPDSLSDFNSIDDLQYIIRTAVGKDLDL